MNTYKQYISPEMEVFSADYEQNFMASSEGTASKWLEGSEYDPFDE